jgi:hypothetical protein
MEQYQMSFVTFIYRIGRKTYFGKYIFDDYVSDDHNGLDTEIMHDVLDAINRYRVKHERPVLSETELTIGILSFCPGNARIPVYSSEEEYKAFDLYYEAPPSFSFTPAIVYINGEIV